MSFQSHEDLYIQLSEDEKELANSLISLSQKVGPINKSDGIWVGYENAENNPTKNIGVKCGNCALHKSENTCIILDQQIEMDGVCRFAVIPDGYVSSAIVKKHIEEYLNENNFKHCAEIGIGYGFHAKQILKNTNIDKLYLVDPMQYYKNDAFADDVIKYGGFEKLINNINFNLKDYENRYTWFRQSSLTITNEQIKDEELDAVFIDADHSYEAVIKDLPFWWKKMRIGGWLLGDDYNSCHPGTKKAVDEFARNNNLTIEFLSKPDATQKGYPIYKFVKL